MASRLRRDNRRSIASDIIRVMSLHGGVILAKNRDIARVIQESGERMDRTFTFTPPGSSTRVPRIDTSDFGGRYYTRNAWAIRLARFRRCLASTRFRAQNLFQALLRLERQKIGRRLVHFPRGATDNLTEVVEVFLIVFAIATGKEVCPHLDPGVQWKRTIHSLRNKLRYLSTPRGPAIDEGNDPSRKPISSLKKRIILRCSGIGVLRRHYFFPFSNQFISRHSRSAMRER
jgi:hypothetical protein